LKLPRIIQILIHAFDDEDSPEVALGCCDGTDGDASGVDAPDRGLAVAALHTHTGLVDLGAEALVKVRRYQTPPASV
jgi:hypothetical protein